MTLVILESTAKSCPPFTASLDVAVTAPSARFAIFVPVPGPASVTIVLPALSYWTELSAVVWIAAICEPLTASVELAAIRPGATCVSLRSMPTLLPKSTTVPLVAAPTVMVPPLGEPPTCWTMPTVPLLIVVLRLLMLVVAALSCEPLTASVDVAETRPAATFWIWRSALGAPTLSALVGAAPANA